MAKVKRYLLNLTFGLLCTLVFASCKDIDSYTVQGNIKGIENPDIYIVIHTDSTVRIDTIQSKAGKFKFKSKSETLESVVIYMEKGNVWVTVWAKNGEDIILTGDANYPELILAKGGETNDLLSDFKTGNKALIKEKGDLRDKILNNSKENGDVGAEMASAQFSSQIKNIDQSLKKEVTDFVKLHPSSVAALVLIQDFLLDIENASDIQPVLSLITGEAKENELYAKLQTWSVKDQQTEVGKPAPDFEVLSTKNDTIRLKTFKDKYLLLMFAASWSPFCESDYPQWLAIRKNFSEKELGMLTISLDENKPDWEKLVKEKGFTWTQVIDNAGWSSAMVSLYNVSEIPCNYLIDKDKRIFGSKIPTDSIQSILTSKLKLRAKN
ncbi:MAG: AhpC/TSA family protein [Candidatus Symbiothrix sp.]|jgi:peroxiredoxin|nr:AhpC/TSA family protein [Candidatus Symbiothrix sp.]